MADETPVTDEQISEAVRAYYPKGESTAHRDGRATFADGAMWYRDRYANPERQRLAAEVRRYREAMAALRAEHKPFRIYTECNHSDEDHERLGIESFDISEGDFVTCEDGFEYEICSLCCEYCGGQGEVCGTSHDHDKDYPICPTRAILDAAMKGEEPAS